MRGKLVPAFVVSVTVRGPGAASTDKLRAAVSCLSFVRLIEGTDTPAPLITRLDPGVKLVPLSVMLTLDPATAVDGLIDVIVGRGWAFNVSE